MIEEVVVNSGRPRPEGAHPIEEVIAMFRVVESKATEGVYSTPIRFAMEF